MGWTDRYVGITEAGWNIVELMDKRWDKGQEADVFQANKQKPVSTDKNQTGRKVWRWADDDTDNEAITDPDKMVHKQDENQGQMQERKQTKK